MVHRYNYRIGSNLQVKQMSILPQYILVFYTFDHHHTFYYMTTNRNSHRILNRAPLISGI